MSSSFSSLGRAVLRDMIVCLAALGLAFLEVAHAEPLRLVGELGSQVYENFVVADENILLRAESGVRPLPRGLRWRVVGDMRANYDQMLFAPTYSVMLDHTWERDGKFENYAACVSLSYDDRFVEKEIGDSMMVVLWVVDGKAAHVAVAPTPRRRGLDADIAAVVAFNLGKSRAGAPAVLMLKAGGWVKPRSRFKDPALALALAELHLGTPGDFERAIDKAKSINGRSIVETSTMLQFAAESGLPQALQALRSRGASWASGNPGWGGPQCAAAFNGRFEAARWLVAQGAPYEERIDRRTPFEQALRNRHVDVAELFVGQQWSDRALQLFQSAVEYNQASLAERLAGLQKARLQRKDGEALLARSITWRNPALVRTVLRLGAEADGGHEGQPFLAQAAALGDLGCVNVLLDAGASVNRLDKGGRSPAEIAADMGSGDVLHRLVAAGAKGFPLTKKPAPAQRRPIFPSSEVDLPPVLKVAVPVSMQRAHGLRVDVEHVTDYVNAWGAQGLELRAVPTLRHRAVGMDSQAVGSSWAVVSLVVEQDGRVEMARALGGSSLEFERSAAQAVRQLEFLPGEVDGKPVRTRMLFAIAPRS